MPGYLRQATASQARALGPFIDDTDFKTTKTGLTIANTDIKLVVNGAASANKNSGGGTHRVNGVYGVTFDATDTAAVGEIEVSVVVSGALPVFDKFYVVEEAVFDALFVASAPGYVVDQPVNATKLAGQTITAAAGVTFPTSVASPTNITAGTITTATNLTNAPTAGDFTATMKTSIGTAVAASAVASVTGNVGGNVTGSVGSVASGGIAAASFAAGAIDAAAIAANAIGASELASDAAAEIASAVRTELTTELGRVDVAVSTRLATSGYTAPDNSSITAIKAKTDNLPSDPADASDIATATSAIYSRLGPPAGASVSADIAAVKSDTAAIKAVTDKFDETLESDTAGYRFTQDALSQAPSGTGASAATIADAVWDEALSGHATGGSAGAALSAAGAAADPWATPLPGAYGSGTAGKILGDNLDAKVSDRLPTSSYTAPLSASATRTAVGLASANLDTQLSAIDADILTRLPTSSYTAPLSAAGTRTAVGLGSANLDTQLGALPTATENAAELLDTEVDGSVTLAESVRLQNSALGAKCSGMATATGTFRDLGDTKDRIVATVDADGNRSAVTRDLS